MITSLCTARVPATVLSLNVFLYRGYLYYGHVDEHTDRAETGRRS